MSSFVGALVMVLGLGLTVTGSAAAAPASQSSDGPTVAADCIGPWQYNSVGSNKAMESCVTAIGSGTFSAKTAVISTSSWTGFHGCVRFEFLDSAGTVVHRSAEQRYGVDAGRTRIIAWSGTAPQEYYLYWTRFVHWRC